MKRNIKIYILGLLGIIAIIPICLSIFKGNIYCDEGYYLSIVDCIGKGFIPYKTLNLGYSPLWFYFLACIKYLFHIPDCIYEPYLIIHYCTLFGCTFFLYKILRIYIQNKTIPYLSCIYFLLASHWLRGGYVLLEIPSVFWGLLSIFIILKKDNSKFIVIFFAGISASCACLCKQYGIGFLILDISILLLKKKQKNIIPLLLGASPLIILCFSIWGQEFGKIWLSNYGAINTNGYFRQEILGKIKQLAWGFAYLIIMVFPGLLLCGFTIRNKVASNMHTPYFIAILGILGFSLQFFFNKSLHYFLFLLPFVCIVFGILLDWAHYQSRRIKLISISICIISLVMTVGHTYYREVLKKYIDGCGRSGYYEVGKTLKEILLEGSTVYFPFEYGPYEQYFFSGFLPPNIEQIGYSFGALGLSTQERVKQSNSADYIITRDDIIINDQQLLDELTNREVIPLSDIGLQVFRKKNDSINVNRNRIQSR